MAVQSKLVDLLPENYGYVVFGVVGSIFLNMWLTMNVLRARKQHNIWYPTMYSQDNDKFNCVQRAHQNTLEMLPCFLSILTLGGLQYPRISGACAAVWILGRIAFALGYYTGDPAKRKWGMFGYIPCYIMIGNTVSFACHQLKWVGPKCCH